MRYLPEIDGLRAISVLAVLLFHLGANFAPGGFVGVDVFFVISGFLITSIIRSDLEAGKFSFGSFYERRIRRILPALVVVMATTIAAGYFLLSPGDYAAVGNSAAYAAASLGNLFFYFNTGYFDAAAETMPLLHTWSLGVEEQFYLVLPILLFLLGRRHSATPSRMAALLCIGVISFALNLWQIQSDPKAVFFLAHYRAWELCCGAVLAYLPSLYDRTPRLLRSASPIVGLVLIAFCTLTYSDLAPYPGIRALAPVAGAALILFQVGRGSVANRILRLRPLPAIGKISYSLYLWHWPVIVFWRHFTNGAPLSAEEQIGIGAASIILAWLSWRWVETPFRHMRPTNLRAIMVGIVSMASIAIPGAMIAQASGLPSRIPPEYASLQSKQKMWDWNCAEEVSVGTELLCIAGRPWDTTSERALVMGDSHAQHLMPMWHDVATRAGMSIGLLANCPPIFKREIGGLRHFDDTYLERCFDARKRLFETLHADPSIRTVIIAGLWPMIGYTVYRTNAEKTDVLRSRTSDDDKLRAIAFARGREYVKKELRDLITELAGQGRRVIVVSDIPTFDRDPIPCVLANSGALLRQSCAPGSEFVTKSQMLKYQLPMAETLRETVAGLPNASIVLPTDTLCASDRCEAYVDGQYIYRDADHLRRNMTPDVYGKLADSIGLTAALVKDTQASHGDNNIGPKKTEARARLSSDRPI